MTCNEKLHCKSITYFSYKQALWAAATAKELFLKAEKSFSKPEGYFCEMIKTDTHMDKINKRKNDQEEAQKKSEEAKKQRALKKFGKKVQIEKMQERQKEKARELDKVHSLKKKHTIDNTEFDDMEFDVGVDDENDEKPKSRSFAGKNRKREHKNKKFGFGGKKRNLKSNTRESSNDMSSYRVSKKPKKNNRPGKKRRMNMKK